MIANKIYNVDLANLPDKKLLNDFEKEMYFVNNALGNKSTRDKSPKSLLKSPAILASGIAMMFLPEYLNEICDRLKLLLQ